MDIKSKDKQHSTNYFNTFIEVADDCNLMSACIPESKSEKKTIATMQFKMLANNPYRYTSDELFFQIYASRNDLLEGEYEAARERFFAKGQPCFRASPLTKQYGFGVHSDENGRIAIYGLETEMYQQLVNDPSIVKVKARYNGHLWCF